MPFLMADAAHGYTPLLCHLDLFEAHSIRAEAEPTPPDR